ncbi:MAG: cytidylate kinase-like family protein [Verrucomicrobiia bacterium]
MSLEARIAAHVHAWEQTRQSGKPRPPETLPFITISREFGCDAADVGQQLVKLLNERCKPVHLWVAYDRELLDKVASELHLRRDLVDALDGHRRDEMSELFDTILNRKMDDALVYRKLAEVIRSLAVYGHSVLIGRGSYLLTQDLKTGIHIRLIAPRDFRIHAFALRSNLSPQEATQQVTKGEKEREHYLRTVCVHDPTRSHYHDLIIDRSRFNTIQIAEIICLALRQRLGDHLVCA